MDPHDERTNLLVLNQVATFRSNWILVNEKLRGANNKIKSLEAELSTVKNKLQYTEYEKEILNHTLNELRKTLRADCEVIDQIQQNKSSFIRIAHETSISEYNKQTTIQTNSVSLTTIDETNVSANLSNIFNQDVPSFVKNSTPRSNQKKSRLNSTKKLGKLPSSISIRKTSKLSKNVSNQVPLLSQNKRSASEILREKTSPSNFKVGLRSKKLIEMSSKIFNRDYNKARDSNKDICDVIVIDFDDEVEENDSRLLTTTDDVFISSDDVYIENEDNGLISNSSTITSKAVGSKNQVDRSKSNKSSNPTLDSNDDFPENEDPHSNSNALAAVSSNSHTEHENVQTSAEEQNSLASVLRVGNIEDIPIISNTQNSNEQPGLILASDTQNASNPSNPPAESFMDSNAEKHIDLTSSTAIPEPDENNFTISNEQKSAISANSETKNPIVLLSQLSLSNEVPQKRNVGGRKRKNLEVVESEEMRCLQNAEKKKKSHPSSSVVSESRSQDTTSSSSSSKTASKRSKSISKKYSDQKKKKFSISNRTYSCKICDVKFSCAKFLSRHLNSTHVGDKRSWTCEICGFITQNQRSFSSHVASKHKKEKCVICERENREDTTHLEKSALNLHILDHHPNPYPDYLRCPYRNDECKEHFSTLNSFDKHVKTIHKDEDLSIPREKIFPGHDFWTCSACGKIFSHSTHLVKHANQTHSKDEKVFCCEFCKFSTSNPKSLRKHFKTLCFEKNIKRK